MLIICLDLCCAHEDGSLPEIDLVSLLEERLPRYTLRADTLTDFSGYGNSDWTLQTPCLTPDIDIELSSEFVKQTLDYFGKLSSYAIADYEALFMT
jgi:HAP1 N-terminal conserved region